MLVPMKKDGTTIILFLEPFIPFFFNSFRILDFTGSYIPLKYPKSTLDLLAFQNE